MDKKIIKEVYNKYISERGREPYLLAEVAFLMTIFFLRLLVLWVQEGRPLIKYLFLFDYHIHHFYFGVAILIISNFLFLVHRNTKNGRVFKDFVSVLFAVGLALVADEMGLLLTMEFDIGGDYWAPQSYYFMIFISLFLLYLLIFKGEKPSCLSKKSIESNKTDG
ncbi:hypothetical protein J7J81_03120 [bacterium]|nr:hypothetical protein [bacterium]